ncbi:MAG: hypothetical protein WBQ03_02995 [Candidatus Sulfotelmatobacter sp.]
MWGIGLKFVILSWCTLAKIPRTESLFPQQIAAANSPEQLVAIQIALGAASENALWTAGHGSATFCPYNDGAVIFILGRVHDFAAAVF